MFLGGIGKSFLGLGINGLNPHCPHQSLDALAINPFLMGLFQFGGNFPRAVKRAVSENFVHQIHDSNVIRADRRRLVIEAAAGNVQKLGLKMKAQLRMIRRDEADFSRIVQTAAIFF